MALGRLVFVAMAVVALASGVACNYTWKSETVQPPLKLGHTTEARTSFTGVIVMRDMELPRRFYLRNSAYFVVVSKDRLRFHVSLVHKWEKIADPSRWRVWLEDEAGNRFFPEAIDRRVVKPVTRHYQVGYMSSVNTYPLLSITVWRGDGDYVFYRRDIFHDKLRNLTLVLQRPGYMYRYSWQFLRAEPIEALARED